MAVLALALAGWPAPAGAQCGSDPGNDTRGEATDLSGACGTTPAAIDCVGDVDYYRFTAPSDGSYTLETTGSTDTLMELQDDEGHVIESDDDDGDGYNASISRNLGMGTTYFIRVNEYGDDATGDYNLVISGCAAGCPGDPDNDDSTHALDIPGCGETHASFECSGDWDWYVFSAPVDGTYTWTISPTNRVAMILYASDGVTEVDAGQTTVSATIIQGDFVYVALSAVVSDDTFSYTLTTSGCPSGCGSDPGNDTRATATGLGGQCGSTPAAFDCAGDVDVYRFVAPSDATMTLETTGSTDTEMRLLDDQGSELAYNDDGGADRNSKIVYDMTRGTTYFVKLNEYGNDGMGNYVLQISGCGAGGCGSDPGNDSISTATALGGCGRTSAAVDCPGDVDFYRFQAPSAGTYSFAVSAMASAYVGLYDPSGNYLDQSISSVSRSLGSGEVVLVRVLAGIAGETFAYDLDISGCGSGSCGSDPGNDDMGSATGLPGCGTTPAAVDCAGDVDLYRFTTPGGGRYTFTTSGGGTTFVRILDVHAAILNGGEDGAAVDLSALQTVFVWVQANDGTSTFAYDLDVSGCSAGGCGADPGDDSIQTASTLVGCTTISAAVDCPADLDVYSFTAADPGRYTFATTPTGIIYMTAMDGSGNVVNGAVSGMTLTLAASQTVYIEVAAFTAGDTPTYDLAVTGCTQPGGCGNDPGDDAMATATPLSGCGAFPARIDCAGDWDYYVMTAPVSGAYTIETTSGMDTELALLDSIGRLIATDDDSGAGYNALITADLVIGSTYFVAVNEYGDDGTGAYSLVVDGCSGSVCTGDPGNNDRSGATPLSVPGSTSAAFDCPGDVDFYALTPATSATYAFETSGSTDTRLWLLDASGASLGFDDSSGSGANARLEHALVAATTYYLKLEEATGATGAYGLEVDQVVQATTYRYVVAASAKVGGVAGTNWVSDLVVYNPGQSSASIAVEAWMRDRDNSTPQTANLSLGPGQLRREQDVLHALFGLDSGAAALHLISDAPLVVASRTFNSTASGTYGQFIAGVPPSQAVAPGDKGYLQGFVENADYRSNLGVVNIEDHITSVKVSFHWPDGKALGSTMTITLAPHSYTQVTQVLAGPASGDVSLAWAELTSADGSFLAYASVVDQRTGDPVYRPVQLAGDGRAELALPGLAKVGGAAGTNWVSDIGFLNPGADQVSLSLELWKRDAANTSPELRQVVLAPGACALSADVLSALFGESSGAASVRLSAGAQVLADGRTFNQVASGTYGQYIAGMRVGDAITNARPAYLVMAEEDGSFRTNLGLMNLSPSASAQVRLSAFDATGTGIGAVETITLGARAVTQLNRVLERFTTASVPLAVVRIEVATPGGQVLAYGSVVDEATGDPVFEVPAMPAP